MTEVDALFNEIVTASGIKGKISLVVVDPAGEPEFYCIVDTTNKEALSTQLLKEFITLIDHESSQLSRIKSELSAKETDLNLHEDGEKKKDRKEKISEIEALKDEKDEINTNLFLLKTGIENTAQSLNIPITTNGEATVLDNLDGGNVKVTFKAVIENGMITLKKSVYHLNNEVSDEEIPKEAEETSLAQYLDISDFTELVNLRNQHETFESMIQSGDTFIFEYFNLNEDDLTSAKKRKFIQENFSEKAHHLLATCCSDTPKLLDDMYDLARNQLETVYVDLKETNEIILQQTIDEILTTTKKQVDIETATLKEALRNEYKEKMKALDIAQKAKYEKLTQAATKKLNRCEIQKFTPEQEVELINQKNSVRSMITNTANHIMQEHANKFDNLMSEIQEALDAQKEAFEQKYPLDEALVANEQTLKLKQLEVEKERLAYIYKQEQQFAAQKEAFNHFIHQQQQANKEMTDQFNHMLQMKQMSETSKIRRMVVALFLYMLAITTGLGMMLFM